MALMILRIRVEQINAKKYQLKEGAMSVIDLFLTSLIYMRRLDLSIPAACMSFSFMCQSRECGTVELEVDSDHPRGYFLKFKRRMSAHSR